MSFSHPPPHLLMQWEGVLDAWNRLQAVSRELPPPADQSVAQSIPAQPHCDTGRGALLAQHRHGGFGLRLGRTRAKEGLHCKLVCCTWVWFGVVFWWESMGVYFSILSQYDSLL